MILGGANDMLQGWQAALRVGKIFWVPFDEHFAHFQQKFVAHKEILSAELERHGETSRMRAYMNLKKLNDETLQHLQAMQAHLKRTSTYRFSFSPPLCLSLPQSLT